MADRTEAHSPGGRSQGSLSPGTWGERGGGKMEMEGEGKMEMEMEGVRCGKMEMEGGRCGKMEMEGGGELKETCGKQRERERDRAEPYSTVHVFR